MILFENMINAVRRLDRGMQDAVKTSLQQPLVEAVMIDFNTAQMNAGEDSENKPIDPPYAELTIAIKRIKGQPWNKVTLRDQGDFQGAITIDFRSDDFFIFSTDEKNDKLTKKYGWQIFGLNDIHLSEIRYEYCLPFLLDYARQEIAKR